MRRKASRGTIDTELVGHNPLADALRTTLKQSQTQLFLLNARRPHWLRRLIIRLFLYLPNRWLDLLLLGVPAGFFLSSFVLFVISHPWSSTTTLDYSDVAIGCASVVALGSIILTAITVGFARAAEFGPGFTTGLLRRPLPWLLGLTIAPLTTFLFWLGTQSPDQEAALAASLLAGGAFASFWAASRSLVGGADSLVIAQQESRRIRTSMFIAIRTPERFISASVPRKNRKTPEVQVALTESRITIATGFVRQLRSAARRCVAKGETDEGFIFLSAMVDSYIEFAHRYQGAVGTENQLTGVVLEAILDFSVSAGQHSDDFVATLCADSLSRILNLPHLHPDSAKARLFARQYLLQLIEAKWNDEHSRLPAAGVSVLADSIARLVSVGAREDAEAALIDLVQLAVKARLSQKAHIENPAVGGFTKLFREFCLVSDGTLRTHYLELWGKEAERLTKLRTIPDALMFVNPLDNLIPGISLGGPGLQHVLVDLISEVPQVYADAVAAICNWLDRCFPELGQSYKQTQIGGGDPEGALSLLLCLSLLGVSRFESGELASKVASRLLTTATRWLYVADNRDDLLLNADFSDVLWSHMLSCGCMADDKLFVVTPSTELLRRWSLSGPFVDSFTINFIAGLYLATGHAPKDVEELMGWLTDPHDQFGLPNRLAFIGSLGLAPSCNRNSTEHYADSIEKVNAWALKNFDFGQSLDSDGS